MNIIILDFIKTYQDKILINILKENNARMNQM